MALNSTNNGLKFVVFLMIGNIFNVLCKSNNEELKISQFFDQMSNERQKRAPYAPYQTGVAVSL